MVTEAVPYPVNKTSVLAAFSRALGREAHVLTLHPDILWQQMYNRLQWGGEDVRSRIAPELALRLAPGDKPWLKMKTPYAESQSCCCVSKQAAA
jgi:hypothetical protein